jgi:trimeric autotransporter adhesin
MRSFSWRAAGAMAAGLAFGALAVPATAVLQAGDPAPRIIAISPSPAGGVHDQVGLPSLDITFTEPVTVGASPLVWGTSGGLIPSSTQLLGGGLVLRINFAAPIAADRVTIVLGEEITDLAGNPLDGEIATPSFGSVPSGDGMPGGLAVLRYDILKGDANGDGLTNPVDVALVVGALGACVGDPDFDVGADLNNDGCVNVLDVQIVLSGQGGSLPPLDGAAPTIASVSRADGSPLTEDLELLAITFSEDLNPLSVIDGVVSVRNFDGTIFAPATTVLAGDGRTIECYFAPPISACGNYTVAVSNAIADLSGELFVPPAQAPGFTGSTPPATPVLNKYTAITSAAGVTISGTIPQKAGFASAVEIRIQGPDQIVTAPVAGNSFSATMPLEANEINYLYVSAISPCGIASAPIVAEVTRDNTAPNLTIQFPSTTQQIFDEAVNVGGTVGDTLSGFEGLTVSVNGQRAVVDIALGQNGTWLAENVPLNRPGQPTTLTVVGNDIVGNQVTQSITVTRASPPRNAAYLEVLSGDDQVGLVGAALRTPIAVKVWKGDGTPFANKLVDFRVTQNDGRLSGPGFGSGTMLYQVLTDASGVASASWTLGGTAGCGNHRVEATAKEVAGIALFSATATADTPDQINIGSGNNQRVEVGAPAPLLLSAWVSDATNPVASVPVTFTVTSGGGLVNGQSQITVPSSATGHADVEFTTGPEPGVNRVEATFPGNRTNPAVFTTYGIKRDFTKPTSFRGLVLDNASRPIGNVKISLKFGTTLVGPKLTNEQGQFEFTDLTNDGAVHVIVEGFLANKLNGQPLPPGVKFPSLGYDTSIVPNAENTLGKPILLPPMLPENTVTWNGQSDIEITCAGIEGLVFRVKANSMTLENGTKPTVNAPVKLSLNQVHHDDIPMPMPNGVAPAFAWTFQPASATFDPPVEIEYPNMSVLPPGAMAYFLTFNHDLGEFEIMAPGRVSEDGSTIVTEPGTGLRLSGWGCNCPPYSVTGTCSCVDDPEVQSEIDELKAQQLYLLGLAESLKASAIAAAPKLSSPAGIAAFAEIPKRYQEAYESLDQALEALQSANVTIAINFSTCSAAVTTLNPLAAAACIAGQLTALSFVQIALFQIGDATFQLMEIQAAIESPAAIELAIESYSQSAIRAAEAVALGQEIQAICPALAGTAEETMLLAEALQASSEFYAIQLLQIQTLELPALLSQFAQQLQDLGGLAQQLYDGVLFLIDYLEGVIGPPDAREPDVAALVSLAATAEEYADEALGTLVALEIDIETYAALGGSAAQASVDYGQAFDNLRPILDFESWFLSISGQVVEVSRDGTFEITNINAPDAWGESGPGSPPDFKGDDVLRIIGSAFVNGQAYYAISDGFQLTQGTVFTPGELTLTTTPPLVPSELDIAGPPLIAVPATTSMVTTATLSDGSTVDATLATSWTTYRTSNPLVATVSKDGVVTAHQQGTVFITALNNAATAVKKILVTNEAAPTTIVGFVQLDDGTPVENAVLVTPLGGKGVSGRDGAFSFEVEVGQQTSTLNVTAVALIRGVTYTGTKLVSPIALDGVTDAGTIVVSAEAGCSGEFGWLPGFGLLGLNDTVSALTVFDDRKGGGPALYAAGFFTTAGGPSANGIAKWDGNSWSPLGTGVANGVNGQIHALTVFDDGSSGGSALYAGGFFTSAGGVAANRIARWDGTSWSSLGTGSANGVSHTVWALTVSDDGSGRGLALYVGGSFTTAGGVPANRIARWNGISWSSLGTSSANGVNDVVHAMTSFDDGSGSGAALYVGGGFTSAGGVTANRIAKWNGSAWSALGTGLSGGFFPVVRALAVFSGGAGVPALYAGGNFTSAGGVPANRMARWNGISWSALGTGSANGMDSFIYALTVFDDGSGGGPALYAGGAFTTAGGVAANRIARWDGTSWTSLGTGSANGVDDSVFALSVFDNGSGGRPALYAVGSFATAGGPIANRIAKWDGEAWSSLGTDSANGLADRVFELAVFDDGAGSALYAGGEFTTAGGVPANRIVRWNGRVWSPLGVGAANGVNNRVRALAVFDEGSPGAAALYVGGGFTTAGGVAANRIAKWDGDSWSALGTGMSGGSPPEVFALAVFDDGAGPALYAGGVFTAAGGVPANRIARWNGTSWSALGADAANGVNNRVLALAVFDEGSPGAAALYVGGEFTTAGGVAANYIAKWDGTSWSALGAGVSGNFTTVRALTVFDDGDGGGPALYAGGRFTTAGGVTANQVAKWNGTSWSSLGAGSANGVNFDVQALTVFDDGSGGGPALYAGGLFTTAGGVTANYIAKWNGTSWSSLGTGSANGVSSEVSALLVFDDGSGGGPALYAGGSFTTAGGVPSNYFAKWGCVISDNDAPSRPQPAVVARGDRRTSTTAASPTAGRTLRRGELLILGDESVRLGTLTALAGSTLRLAHPNAHLTVSNLLIEPGATFEWLAGTIEIDAGAWIHPYELAIGCEREAKLLLTADAFVRAPQVTICGLGSLVGQGSVDAPTTNAGTVAGEGSGLRVLGPYGHEPSGTIAASVAELAAIAADQLHPCEAVDELNASNETEPIQRIDVDRDGDLDLVRRVRLGVGALSILWLDRGDGAFGTPILCGSELASQRISIEHLDDDGLLDLLITSDEGHRCHALSGGAVEVLR